MSLGRERKFVSDLTVETPLQGVLAKLFATPCQLAQSIAGGINSLKCAQQSARLFFGRCKFDLRRQFDAFNIIQV
jgi:hypothetical protein